MKNGKKIKALGALMLLTASLYSQSDSLGMPGDNLDLKAVLSIFKQSSSIEDFEKRLNSADTKINNLDLNGDNQVDYLRVVDYGKEDFHSIVIQDPVSKSESQDVAVIVVVKKDDNTAHIQIVGDETLYGKDYIIEPENQAPLNDDSSKKKQNTAANDDVYESGNSTTHVMINVWAWPSVSYIYSPGYTYWASPWHWGYYPGWYSPWRPYGWGVYHRNFYGYNYGFYGYRRHRHAYPHAHNYYYGRRVSSGYVQKTAPHYGKRNGASQGTNNRNESQRNNKEMRNQNSNRNENSRNSQNKTTNSENRKQNTSREQKSNSRSEQRTSEKSRNSEQRKSGQNKSRGSGGENKVKSTPKSGGGSGRSGGSGGSGGARNNGGGRSQNR